MVWNSTLLFFPAFLLLFFLPSSALGITWIFIFTSSLFLLAALRFPLRPFIRKAALACIFILLLLGLRENRFNRLEQALKTNIPDSEYIDLEGTVTSQILSWPDGGSSFLLCCRSIRYHRETREFALTVQVNLTQGFPPEGLAKGADIELSARLNPLMELANFRLKNRTDAILSRGIDWQASCKSSRLITVVRPAPLHWRLVRNWRERLNRAIDRLPYGAGTAALSAPLFKSIFLGHPFQGDDDTRRSFMTSGALHLVAISGTHIALVTGFSMLLFFWAPPGFRRIICALIILFYLLQAAAPVSAQRAAVAAWAWLWASHRKRKMHMPHILGAAGCVDLLLNPLIVHSSGFILTYSICFSFVYWSKWLGFSRKNQGGHSLFLRIRALLKTQWLVLLTSSPLTLHLFNQAALAALPAGLLLIPLFGLLLPVAAASLLIFMAIPASITVTGHLLTPVVSLLQEILTFFSHWDALLLYRRAPPAWAIFTYLGLLYFTPFLLKRKTLQRSILLSLFGFFIFLLLPDRPYHPETVEIHAPNIGQGELTALVFPDGTSMLVDCGGTPFSSQLSVSRLVSAYLLNNRIHPRWIAVSHFHADHCGTLPDLIRIFKPEAVLVSEQPCQNPLFIQAKRAGGRHTRWITVARGDSMITAGSRLTWLYPDQAASEADETRNGHSQVIRLDCTYFSMLFCGDIGIPEELNLVNACGPDLDTDILKAPHHGSKGSSSEPFLHAVSPKLSIFHCGRHNPFHFPHPETVTRYKTLEILSWRTWEGGIIISDGKDRIRLNTASERLIPGFHALIPSRGVILDF